MRTAGIITGLMLVVSGSLHAQTVDQTVQQGNEQYKKEQFQQAETTYNDALTKDPANAPAKFNKVNAVFKQGKSDEAVRMLNDLAFKTENNDLKSRAYYNKGAILSNQKKLEESIEAYKDALRRNPSDTDARENLQKALTELKKKNPPTPKENKKQQQQQQKQKEKEKPQPKMNQKEAEQRLKLLEQKEKEVQQRLQKEKSKSGGGQQKDW